MLKREPVLGGYDPSNYATEFAWATARDGTKVPVSIVYRKTTPRDGSAPLLQIGYGSYGSTYDPEFSYLPPSLLDRGFVVAIAHIRGGQEMGRAWYENGKLLNKKNSFTDFIDVTRWLAANKYSDPKRAFALGPLRRRPAHGRHRQHGAAGLSRHRRRRAVRRRGHHHAR